MPVVEAPPPIICSVVKTDLGGSMRFQGRIVSREPVVGTYAFAITKSGPSGRSVINQGGRFAAPADAETMVGSATVSVEQGAGYDVRLRVEVGQNVFTCEPLTGGKP